MAGLMPKWQFVVNSNQAVLTFCWDTIEARTNPPHIPPPTHQPHATNRRNVSPRLDVCQAPEIRPSRDIYPGRDVPPRLDVRQAKTNGVRKKSPATQRRNKARMDKWISERHLSKHNAEYPVNQSVENDNTSGDSEAISPNTSCDVTSGVRSDHGV